MMPAAPTSTGFGRVLDALSCYFGICQKRTYDGEPAMKLERTLSAGTNKFNFNVKVKNNVILTSELYRDMTDSVGTPSDLSYSFVYALLDAMVDIAADNGELNGIKTIGLTGGVSYNGPISSIVKDMVESRGFRFVCHSRVPNGDGGISTGQCAIALQKLN